MTQPSIYNTLDEQKTPVTLLLKGAPGSGKTWKAAQLPGVALFNFDNNLSGLRKLPKEVTSKLKIVNPNVLNGKVIPSVNVWDNYVTQLQKVAADPEVKTIVIDSLSTMQDKLCHKILKTEAPAVAMQIQHWGEMSRYLKWLAEYFLQANDLDKNVVIIAHERLIEDSLTSSIRYVLNLGGSMKDNFDLYFSDCWRCYTRLGGQGEVIHRVRTLPGSNFNAKRSFDVPTDFEWEKEKDKIIKRFEEVGSE